MINMKAIKPTELRDKQKELLDMAAGGETLFVHRPQNKNVYVISEEDYKAMSQAYRNAQFRAKLDQAKKDIESGKGTTFSIDDLEKIVEERTAE